MRQLVLGVQWHPERSFEISRGQSGAIWEAGGGGSTGGWGLARNLWRKAKCVGRGHSFGRTHCRAGWALSRGGDGACGAVRAAFGLSGAAGEVECADEPHGHPGAGGDGAAALWESLFAGVQVGARVDARATLLDFGSGAGFPGLPIQLLLPGLRVTLAESQGKKASFLREAVRTLGLGRRFGQDGWRRCRRLRERSGSSMW